MWKDRLGNVRGKILDAERSGRERWKKRWGEWRGKVRQIDTGERDYIGN